MKYKFKKSTKAGIFIAIVLSLFTATMNSYALYRNYDKLSTAVRIYGVFFALLMVVSVAGLIVCLLQHKIGLIVTVISMIINIIYGVIVGASPMEYILVFLPIVYSCFSMGDAFKKLPL
ncbi:MAG: hypothetical protein ACI4D4_01755 [Lachnospira sp.]